MYLMSVDRNKYRIIEPDDKNIDYIGRIDFTDKKAPTIIYAGSGIRTKFEGTSIKIVVQNKHLCYENYIGYIIDGNICGKILLSKENKKKVIHIMSGLSNKVHELIIIKRQDACHYFDFYGLLIDKGCKVFSPERKSTKKIECFGDSLAVGELCESLVPLNKKQIESYKGQYSNAGLSFPIILASYLKAEVNNNAQGGLAVLNGTGFFRRQRYLGLEFTYDKLRYNPELGMCTKWDFSRYIPHVVIMEFGNYDWNPCDFINDKEKKDAWKEKYKFIIRDLRSKYPKALFILITSILQHDLKWDDAMDEIQEELEDSKVVRYKFIRNGCGPKEYLSVHHQAEMAQELFEFINSFGNEIWI